MGFKNKEKCTKTLYHRTKEFNLNSANEKVFFNISTSCWGYGCFNMTLLCILVSVVQIQRHNKEVEKYQDLLRF